MSQSTAISSAQCSYMPVYTLAYLRQCTFTPELPVYRQVMLDVGVAFPVNQDLHMCWLSYTSSSGLCSRWEPLTWTHCPAADTCQLNSLSLGCHMSSCVEDFKQATTPHAVFAGSSDCEQTSLEVHTGLHAYVRYSFSGTVTQGNALTICSTMLTMQKFPYGLVKMMLS